MIINEKFIDAVRKIKVGNPLDENADMGALVSRGHLETMDNMFKIIA